MGVLSGWNLNQKAWNAVGIEHWGDAGRIVCMKMRLMSLFKSGGSTGEVSLTKLFAGELNAQGEEWFKKAEEHGQDIPKELNAESGAAEKEAKTKQGWMRNR